MRRSVHRQSFRDSRVFEVREYPAHRIALPLWHHHVLLAPLAWAAPAHPYIPTLALVTRTKPDAASWEKVVQQPPLAFLMLAMPELFSRPMRPNDQPEKEPDGYSFEEYTDLLSQALEDERRRS